MLDELIGEATGKQFSPTIQPAPSVPQTAGWFQTPQEVQEWNYNTETMAGPPGYLADTNLANVITPKVQGMGYTGPTTTTPSTEADTSQGQVSPEFVQWLQSQGLQLGGESTGVNGLGGVKAFLTDQTGNRVAQEDYASDDSDMFNVGVGLLGLGAFSAVNAGVGAASSGAGQAASGGLFGGEGAAQLAAADLAVTPEALAAITPEIGGLGEVAALGGSQVGALNPNMFANEGLAQLTANPPVVSAAELSAITPNVSAIGITPVAASGVNPVRAGEIAGYQTNGALPASAAVDAGGGLLNTITNAAGGATQWLKDNQVLGRLLMSGAGALTSGLGGSGGGSSPAPTNYGSAKQWTSPLGAAQSGLLSAPRNVQQVQPGGLLGGPGVANSGAWQWRK